MCACIYICICVCMCIFVYICIYVDICIYACIMYTLRLEQDIGWLPLSLLLFLSISEMWACYFSSTGCRALGICLSPFSSVRVTGMYSYAWLWWFKLRSSYSQSKPSYPLRHLCLWSYCLSGPEFLAGMRGKFWKWTVWWPHNSLPVLTAVMGGVWDKTFRCIYFTTTKQSLKC